MPPVGKHTALFRPGDKAVGRADQGHLQSGTHDMDDRSQREAEVLGL